MKFSEINQYSPGAATDTCNTLRPSFLLKQVVKAANCTFPIKVHC